MPISIPRSKYRCHRQLLKQALKTGASETKHPYEALCYCSGAWSPRGVSALPDQFLSFHRPTGGLSYDQSLPRPALPGCLSYRLPVV